MKATFKIKVNCNNCRREFIAWEKLPFGFNWSAKGIECCPFCDNIVTVKLKHSPNFNDEQYINSILEGIFYIDSQTLCE